MRVFVVQFLPAKKIVSHYWNICNICMYFWNKKWQTCTYFWNNRRNIDMSENLEIFSNIYKYFEIFVTRTHRKSLTVGCKLKKIHIRPPLIVSIRTFRSCCIYNTLHEVLAFCMREKLRMQFHFLQTRKIFSCKKLVLFPLFLANGDLTCRRNTI